MFTKKNNFKQHISILEDGASGEQVGDIETIIVKNLFKLLLHYMKLMNLQKKILWPQVYDEFKEYEKKFKFKIMKIIFSQLFLRITLMIGFEDPHINILYLST